MSENTKIKNIISLLVLHQSIIKNVMNNFFSIMILISVITFKNYYTSNHNQQQIFNQFIL